MSSNKVARERLEYLFGAKCFIEKLHLRKETKDKRRRKKFKGSKKRRKTLQKLTYHHIIEEHLGGKATVENGALLSEENHSWFHEQPLSSQINMDKKFQEYKIQILKQKGIFNQFQEDFDVPQKSLYDGKEKKSKSKRNSFKERLRFNNAEQELPPKINRAKRKANDRELFKEYLGR